MCIGLLLSPRYANTAKGTVSQLSKRERERLQCKDCCMASKKNKKNTMMLYGKTRGLCLNRLL